MKFILIADKQDITKAGLLYLLKEVKEVLEIGETDTKKELLTELAKKTDSVVVLDFANFDFQGMEDLLNVSYRFKNVHWVLFSDELSSDFLRHLLYNNTHFSVVFKDSSKEEILSALTLALKKERYICNLASNQLIGKHNQQADKLDNTLTSTEKEILRLVAMGKSTKEVAQERFSSIHTITTHRKNIFRKLGVNSVYEATKYALRSGIIDSAEYYI
jgi:two-component system, NarL family, response regulator LiaR